MAKQRKRQSYPESFRREAVRLADQPGRTATEVAKELGIHPGQIYNWRTQYNNLSKGQFTVADGTNYSKQETAEVRRLKKKVAELELERDFLKKATVRSTSRCNTSSFYIKIRSAAHGKKGKAWPYTSTANRVVATMEARGVA